MKLVEMRSAEANLVFSVGFLRNAKFLVLKPIKIGTKSNELYAIYVLRIYVGLNGHV